MASFWSRIARALDRVLGDPPLSRDELDPALVEDAIRLIQTHVDADRRDRQAKRLRVADLSPEHRAELAHELARLLKQRRALGDQGSALSDGHESRPGDGEAA